MGQQSKNPERKEESGLIQKLTRHRPALPKGRVLAVAGGFLLALAILDELAIPRMSFTLLHVMLVGTVSWLTGWRAGLVLALLSTAALTYNEWTVTSRRSDLWVLYWNLGVRLGVLVIVATLSAAVQEAGRRLEERVQERTAELSGLNAELRQSQTALQQSVRLNRVFSQAVEQSPASVMITDPQGNIEHVNKRFTQVTGYALEEVRGRNPRLLKSGETPALTYTDLWRTITSGQEWRGELHNRKKNGELFWELALISPLMDETGCVTHFLGVKEDITDRKRVERWAGVFGRLGAELSTAVDARAAARTILDAAQVLFTWDAAYVSRHDPGMGRFTSIFGMDTFAGQCEEVPPGDLDGAYTPLSRRVMKLGAQLLNAEQPEASQIEFTRFGNRDRPSASRMFVPIRKSGEFIGILSIQSYTPNKYTAQDLTNLQALADFCGGALQRIAAAEALRESEEKFRALFESAPIGIALHGANGRILHTNLAYQKLLGYTAEELRQLGVKGVTFAEDVVEGQWLYGELRDGERDRYQREKRYARKDGQLVWGQSFVSAIRGTNDELVYIISMVEDITERRQAELAMRELAAIVEHSRDAIFSTTPEGKIMSWNKSAERIFDFTEQEVLGRSLPAVLAFREPQDWKRLEQQLLAQQPAEERESCCRRKGGAPVFISMTGSPIRDNQGRVTGISAIARDVTEKKRLEQEVLRVSTEERRRIGHDLHDGLGQLLAGIAFKTKALQGQLDRCAPKAATEIETIVNLINGAIRKTRQLAHGLDPLEVESAGLVAALQKLAADAQDMFGIECRFSGEEPATEVTGEPALAFYRIAQEAIRNAHTHGHARHAEVKLSRSGDQIVLTVSNDGRGFQTQPQRTGMGLRIMEHRARSMGGTFEVRADAGHGMAIICSVPLGALQPDVAHSA